MSKMKGVDFSFIQISDSHIGFNKEANPDVTATLQVAVDRINSSAAPRISFCIPVTFHNYRSRPNSIPLSRCSRGPKRRKSSTFPANTTCLPMTANNIWTDSARTRKERASTASITRARISLVW